MNLKLHSDLQTAKNRIERLSNMVGWNSAGLQLYGKEELFQAKDEFHRLRVAALNDQIQELESAKAKIIREHEKEVEARHVIN